jgi:hypothetical protein
MPAHRARSHAELPGAALGMGRVLAEGGTEHIFAVLSLGSAPPGPHERQCPSAEHDGDQGGDGRLGRSWPAAHVSGWQRGHGRGASLGKPSIRVVWSIRRTREAAQVGGADSSAGESWAARPAHGRCTPLVFAPVNASNARGVQPASSSCDDRGENEPLCGDEPPVAAQGGKELSAGSPRAATPSASAASRARAAAGGFEDGSADGSDATAAPRGCARCTPSAHRLHLVVDAGCNDSGAVTLAWGLANIRGRRSPGA